jgi:hypothetical protein
MLSTAMLTPFAFAAIALAGDILGFTEVVSPPAQVNATEPSVAVAAAAPRWYGRIRAAC